MNERDLLALAERVEQASGPDRELDCLIAVGALGFFEIPPRWDGDSVGYDKRDSNGSEIHPGHGGNQLVPRLTASLDAAMSLVDPSWDYTIERDGCWLRWIDGSATVTPADTREPIATISTRITDHA